eukprot:CFRG7562T1
MLTLECAKAGWVQGAPISLVLVFTIGINISTNLWLGNLGIDYLSSASLAVLVCNITGNCMMEGVSSALEALCSQAYGAKQFALMGVLTQRVILIQTLLAIPVGISWVFTEKVLLILGVDAHLACLAGAYARVLVVGIWPYATFEAIKRYLYAQSLSQPVSIASMVVGFLNPFLNLLMVKYLDLGYLGVAWSIVVGQWMILFIVGIILMNNICGFASVGIERTDSENLGSFTSVDSNSYIAGDLVSDSSTSVQDNNNIRLRSLIRSGRIHTKNKVLSANDDHTDTDECVHEHCNGDDTITESAVDMPVQNIRRPKVRRHSSSSRTSDHDHVHTSTEKAKLVRTFSESISEIRTEPVYLDRIRAQFLGTRVLSYHFPNNPSVTPVRALGLFCTDTTEYPPGIVDPLSFWPVLVWGELWKDWYDIVLLAVPAGLSILLEWVSFDSSTIMAAHLGKVPLAVHCVYLQIVAVWYIIPLGISTAYGALVGQAIGKKEVERVRNLIHTSLVMVTICGALTSILWTLFGRYLWVAVWTQGEEVRKLALASFPVLIVYTTLDCLKCITIAILRGCGFNKASAAGGVVMSVAIIPSTFILSHVAGMGIVGIWLGLSLAWALASVVLVIVLLRKDWEKEAGKDLDEIVLLSESENSSDCYDGK